MLQGTLAIKLSWRRKTTKSSTQGTKHKLDRGACFILAVWMQRLVFCRKQQFADPLLSRLSFSGPMAMIRFQVWCVGKDYLEDYLVKRLQNSVQHAYWDVLMEYQLLTCPVFQEVLDEPGCFSEPPTPVKGEGTIDVPLASLTRSQGCWDRLDLSLWTFLLPKPTTIIKHHNRSSHSFWKKFYWRAYRKLRDVSAHWFDSTRTSSLRSLRNCEREKHPEKDTVFENTVKLSWLRFPRDHSRKW